MIIIQLSIVMVGILSLMHIWREQYPLSKKMKRNKDMARLDNLFGKDK